MQCLIYARVSTERQADGELSIPAQLQAMRNYAAQQGWTIQEEFLEAGVSNTGFWHSGLSAAMADE